jgi:hypothetical protein
MPIRIRSTFNIGGRLQLAGPLDIELEDVDGRVRVTIDEAGEGEGSRQLVVESTVDDGNEEASVRRGGDGPDLKAIGDRYGSQHAEIANRTRRFLRWRLNLDDDASVIGQPLRLTWTDDTESGSISRNVMATIHLGAPTTQARYAVVPDDLADRIASARNEPIAHELLREALHVQATSRRAALVLGMAALEAGVKGYVSDVVPHATWLLENIPSPPIVEILERYIVSLPARLTVNGEVVVPPRSVTNALRSGVTARNDLVHRGAIRASSELVWPASRALRPDRLTSLLVNVRDVLYLLDFYAGEAWAAKLVGGDTGAALVTEAARARGPHRSVGAATPGRRRSSRISGDDDRT